jgi:HEAT repeat protein
MLNPKSLLKVLPIVLLSFGSIVGMGGVARSQPLNQTPSLAPQVAPQVEAVKESVPDLIKLLKHSDKGVRLSAAYALGAIGEAAIPSLILSLKDPNADVRFSAAYALGWMGKSAKAAIPSLIPLLKDNDENVRFSAVITLGSMGELAKAAIPSLIPLLKDDSVRLYAAIALGEMGESAKAAIPSLMPLLKDANEGVRFSAARALGKMGESAIPSLTPLLKDADKNVRGAAADALREMGESDKAAIPSLIPLLKDADASVRLSAARALGSMGDSAKSAIPHLVPLLKDEDELVRGYAAAALEKLGYKPSSATPAKVATPSLTPLPQLSQGSVANAQSEEFVRQIFVQELKNIQLSDKDPDANVRSIAAWELRRMGESAKIAIPRVRPTTAIPSLAPPPELLQRSVADVQSEEFVRQIFVQELKNIQLPDRAVEYQVMLKSDGSITQIFPMGSSAEQLLPRLKIVIGSPVKGKLPLPANANAVPKAFRVLITSDEVRVFSE